MKPVERLQNWIRGDADPEDAPARSVFIVGLGRFGSALAQRLVALDVDVMAIDVSQELVNEWSGQLTEVRRADGTNSSVLKQLGAAGFDAAVVAIGTGIEASILTTAALKNAGATNIWAKAITSEHGEILELVGAHHVEYPERQAGERVAHILAGRVLDYFPLDEGFVLAELATPADLVGVALGDSAIRQQFGVTVVCIKPLGSSFTYASAETVLSTGDLLVVAGTVHDVGRFAAHTTA